jgi:phenylpyruvate tautomerase PptA (4-oxalocrotonate tautomerase family)
MPFLHLDLPLAVAAADRRRIAARLARLYAEVMQTNPERVTVAFRELGESGVVRLGAGGEVEPVLVVQCDIRRGRPPAQRQQLGAAVAAVLSEELGWPPERTILEFTQHAGDEFWRVGGLGTDWTPAEGLTSRPA